MILANKAYLDALQAKADAMKEAVLSTESDWRTPGITPPHIYYFSADGDDTNDGLSEASPKQSLAALANLPLAYGDVILFRRGDLFRGYIRTVSGVTYSAYGEGAKPTIASSRKNFADPALWEPTAHKNVWKLAEPCKNVGIITFGHSGVPGDYHQPVGMKKIPGVGGFETIADLASDFEFYSDMETDELWVFCEGNPGSRFSSIEIGEYGCTISVGTCHNVTVDNLHITLTGSHGVSAGDVKNLTVRNCLFDWLGGSVLPGFGGGNRVRYGNAVEVYGACDGYYVYNNWMYQIYDTGVTHQYNVTPTKKVNLHSNVDYYDNLIEYCFWSLEYYNFPVGDCVRGEADVHIHDNFCRFGGEGWGCVGRADHAPFYRLGYKGEPVRNYVNENNIFDRCTGYLIAVNFWDGELPRELVFRNNTYVQTLGGKLARILGEDRFFDETVGETLKLFGETGPTLIYLNPTK